MKKLFSLFIVIMSVFMLCTSVLAIPEISPTTVEISHNYDNFNGMIQWLGYLLDIILIIITIISTIVMIKKKKSIGKIILFDLIMVVVILLLAYGTTALGLRNMRV